MQAKLLRGWAPTVLGSRQPAVEPRGKTGSWPPGRRVICRDPLLPTVTLPPPSCPLRAWHLHRLGDFTGWGGTPERRERELKRQGPFTNLVPRETSRSQAWVVWSGRLANLQSAALATWLPGTPTHHARVSPANSWSGFLLGVPASSRGLSETPQRPARPEPAAFTPALRSFQAEGLRVQHLAFPGDAQSQRRGTSKCPSPEGEGRADPAGSIHLRDSPLRVCPPVAGVAPSRCPNACFQHVCLRLPRVSGHQANPRLAPPPGSPPCLTPSCLGRVSAVEGRHPGSPGLTLGSSRWWGRGPWRERRSLKPSSSSAWWGHSPPPLLPAPIAAVCQRGGTWAVRGLAGSLVPGLAQCRCLASVCWGRQRDRVLGGSG